MAPAIPGTARSAQANNSVRAKSKQDSDNSRKTVFRPVLDNPLNVNWPPVPAHIRQQLLDALLLFLTTPQTVEELPIAEWRLQEHARRRGRTHGAGQAKGKGKEKESAELGHGKRSASAAAEQQQARKKVKLAKEKGSEVKDAGASHTLALRSEAVYTIPDFVDKAPRPKPEPRAPLPRPKLLDHLSVGINEVTRALETRVRWGRWELGDPSAAPGGGLGGSVKDVEEGKAAAQKTEDKKNNRRKDRPATKPSQQVLRPPLDPLRPSPATLARPSYRFLTQGIYAPNSSSLPPYLLPPDEKSPFFRMLANAHKEKVRDGKPAGPKPGKRLAALLLPDVIESDHIKARAVPSEKPSENSKGRGKGKAKEVPAPKEMEASGAKSKQSDAPVVEPEQEQSKEEDEDDWVPVLDLIFVCKPDINPPSLVAHLPTMAAAANGVQQALEETMQAGEKDAGPIGMDVDEAVAVTRRPEAQNVLLIPLDIGAERKLADALALRRVAAIGISSRAPGIEPLLALVRTHIQPLRAPWLVPHLTSTLSKALAPAVSTFIPTHVKHLRTTAPLNPKAANAAKKAAKKEKRGKLDVYVAEEEE